MWWCAHYLPVLRIFIQIEVLTEVPTSAPTKAPTETPTKAPTKAPTEAPTSAPTKAPTDAPTASYTPTLTAKGQQCAAGHAIDIKDECETAIQGATWKGEKASRNRPFGCFLAGNKVFYNPTPVSKRKVWKGSKAICKGGDFVAALAAYTSAKKGKNCADGEIVDDEDTCKAAANKLGMSFKKAVNSKTRPAGCFSRGYKMWFNIRTEVFKKGRYGKFTGVCMAK